MSLSLAPAEPTVVAPHPPLPRYYQAEEQKRGFVRQVFDNAAVDYERLESLMAIGSGRWYRRHALLNAGLAGGNSVLDVAVGTGLLAREAMRIVGPSGRVIGIDPSRGMLAEAAKALPIRLILARAEDLPFAPSSFDFLSMGFALRHVSDLSAMFRQFMAVLRPGGKLCLLEITWPRRRISQSIMRMYVRQLIPGISRIMRAVRPARRQTTIDSAQREARSRLLWQYYSDTMTHCIEPQHVLAALNDAGFEQVKRQVELGIFSQYTARRPAVINTI